ncbi:MAG TPA: carboxypeptidase regulatory-like domain-containing protein [Longimicrobiales bacterium]|nr:carboxypeptidase regulatory-like domain-containing protein [Longimicrobiales bacterium]
MTTRHAFLSILLFIAAGCIPAAVAAQVRGYVTDGSSGDPVAGALVWLTGRTIHLTRSAADGTYEFIDAPAGSYCLRVDSPGYDAASVCISVSANASMIVDLPLDIRPVAIAPLMVSGRRGVVRGSTGSARDSLNPSLAALDLALPATAASRLAAAQLGDLTHMPASDPAGGGRPHALYVWGSSAERGRVLLDGATLNAPLHLGALLPPLDPNIVGGADVRSGGISPRYDGGTSYIMDFSTRPAGRQSGVWGELDLLAGRIGAETPIGAHAGVVFSARRVNDEVIDGLVASKFGYGYADALARADVDLGDDSGLHVTALTTQEAVSIPRDQADDRASWKNHAATLEWQRDQAGDMRTATLSMSRGIADLPLLSAVGGHLEASLDRFSGMVERQWSSEALHWTAGAEAEHLVFRRRSRALQDPVTGEAGAVECTAALPCSHAHATLISAFGEVSLSPASGVQARVGARTMYDIGSERVHVMPRASVTLLPTQHYSITIAAGRFSQPYVRETPLFSGADRVDVPIEVDVARATHLELGIARHSGASYIRAGAYLRHHDSVDPATRTRTVPGADVAVEHSMKFGTVSLAYSISGAAGVVLRDPQSDGERDASPQQLATAGFRGSLGRWQLELNTAYGAGLPLTSIVLEQPVDASPLLDPQRDADGDQLRSGRSYLRADASVGAEWRIGAVRVTPYVRIINALGQRESLFYFRDAGAEPRRLARLPAIPIVGVRWQF